MIADTTAYTIGRRPAPLRSDALLEFTVAQPRADPLWGAAQVAHQSHVRPSHAGCIQIDGLSRTVTIRPR